MPPPAPPGTFSGGRAPPKIDISGRQTRAWPGVPPPGLAPLPRASRRTFFPLSSAFRRAGATRRWRFSLEIGFRPISLLPTWTTLSSLRIFLARYSFAARCHPREYAEISPVRNKLLFCHIDAHSVSNTLSSGTSPDFHPPEGGKAMRLRYSPDYRGFAGVSALAPGHFSNGFFVTRPIAPYHFWVRRFAGLSYQPRRVDFRA